MSDFSEFVELISSIQDTELLEDFLVAVTTPAERKALLQRVEIVKKLVSGIPQLQIANELGVGVATVTRGSKELAEGRFKALRK
jgi:TrpR family trp operon transcriptional repressor